MQGLKDNNKPLQPRRNMTKPEPSPRTRSATGPLGHAGVGWKPSPEVAERWKELSKAIDLGRFR